MLDLDGEDFDIRDYPGGAADTLPLTCAGESPEQLADAVEGARRTRLSGVASALPNERGVMT